MAEEEELQKLTFKPEMPSMETKGLKDSRKLFAEPRGID